MRCCGCCVCCEALPTRDYDSEKTILGPCCADMRCIMGGKNQTWCQSFAFCDIGCEKLLWMFQTPVNPKLGSYDLRPIMDHETPGVLKVVHDLPKGAWHGGCTCMGCVCCMPLPRLDCTHFCYGKYIDIERQRQQAEYTWVMENRMEINRPHVSIAAPKDTFECCTQAVGLGFCCGELRVVDNVTVAYYDDEMFDVIKSSKGCLFKFKQWWFGGYGEPIHFKRRMCPRIAPCIPAAVLGHTVLDVNVPDGTAADYVAKIVETRDRARQHAGVHTPRSDHGVVKGEEMAR